jgi:hypothetical protein
MITPTKMPRYDISANCTLHTAMTAISVRKPNRHGEGGEAMISAVTGSTD